MVNELVWSLWFPQVPVVPGPTFILLYQGHEVHQPIVANFEPVMAVQLKLPLDLNSLLTKAK